MWRISLSKMSGDYKSFNDKGSVQVKSQHSSGLLKKALSILNDNGETERGTSDRKERVIVLKDGIFTISPTLESFVKNPDREFKELVDSVLKSNK